MEAVRDRRLVGYWSSKNLSIGAMEAADIAFRPDGDGWIYWSNLGGFEILRFRWHTAGGQLTLDPYEAPSGTWRYERGRPRYRVTSEAMSDTTTVLTYEISQGRDVLGRPATLLETGQPIRLGTVGSRFAFERQLAAGERDPLATRGS